MGFEPDIRTIIQWGRPVGQRQTCMFSATWPEGVQRMAAEYVSANYVKINIGEADQIRCNTSVTQVVHVIPDNEKANTLVLLLDRDIPKGESVLLFCGAKQKCDLVVEYLGKCGRAAFAIHSNKDQNERERLLDHFRSTRGALLVATDVAARGLDVKGLNFIVNVDMVQQLEDHVHRIGRCGRAGKAGIAHTFFTENDAPKARQFCDMLEEARQHVPQKLRQYAERTPQAKEAGKGRYGKGTEAPAETKQVRPGGEPDPERSPSLSLSMEEAAEA